MDIRRIKKKLFTQSRTTIRIVLVAVFFFLNNLLSAQTNYYVNDASTHSEGGGSLCTAVGNDSNDGLSTSTPKLTISDVLNDYTLTTGDIIHVDVGTNTSQTLITMSTADDYGFTIQGVSESQSILDDDDSHRLILSTGGADNVTIKDITIKDFAHTTNQGGAIIVWSSQADGWVFQNVTFESNTARDGGGALAFHSIGDITFTDCTFKDNSTTGTDTDDDGGALELGQNNAVDVVIDGCIFYSNSSANEAGALKLQTDGTVSIINSLFYENSCADYGGALTGWNTDATINNCTFADNTGSVTGGVVCNAGSSHTFTIKNCIGSNNSNLDFDEEGSGVVNLTSCQYSSGSSIDITGNTNGNEGDACFTDRLNDDYTLSISSPARDDGEAASAEAVDINNTSRPINTTDDIGCYEESAPSCTVPGTQATSLTYSSVLANGFTLSWTRGNGNNVAVFVSTSKTPDTAPVAGASYTANTTYASGTALGSGYCVYNGTSTTVTVTGLSSSTTYYAYAYEYNTTGTCYNTDPAEAGSQTTTTAYYVNDASTHSEGGGSICTAVGNDSNNGTSTSTPKLTIADVLNDYTLTTGDVIYVDVGTNSSQTEIALTSDDAGFTIQGVSSTTSIIDDNSTHGFMTITGGSDNVTIKNLTIKDFDETADEGGAFEFTTSQTDGWVFEDVIFQNCVAANGGGAVHSDVAGDLTFTDCVFNSCSADGGAVGNRDGGAIEIESNAITTNLTIDGCQFYSNTSQNNAGAIKLLTSGTVTIKNSLFYENDATGNGGAFLAWNTPSTINNCTFADNTSTGGTGGVVQNGNAVHTMTMTNCLGYNNTLYDFDEAGSNVLINLTNCHYTAGGNIDVTGNTSGQSGDPLFNDSANDDYTLQAISTCVDAGDAGTADAEDINNTARPVNGSDDIGCYEAMVNTWDGSSSGDWETAANWQDNAVPTTSYDVIIVNAGTAPTVDESTAVCDQLYVQSGATLTINAASSKLDCSGTATLDNGGTIVITQGELECETKFDWDGALTMNHANAILDVNGELELSSTMTETIETTGSNIYCSGTWDGASDDGGFTPTEGTVTLDGTDAATVDLHANGDFANLTIDKSSNGVTMNSALDINGSLTISNGTFDVSGSNYQVNCAGNFTSNGTLTEGTATFEFDGGANQDISGTDLTLHDVTLNNSSGDVDLLDDASITGTLTLTAGDLIIETAENLTIDDTDDPGISAGSASTHIVTSGTATIIDTYSSTTKLTYPLGDGTNYRPLAITPSAATSQAWTVAYQSSAHPDTDVDGSGLDHVSQEEYWTLDRSASVNAVLEVTWTTNNNVDDYTQLELAHYDGTTDWDLIDSSPVGDNNTGTLTTDAAVTTFSPFTFGSKTADNPLPVNLLSLETKCIDEGVVIEWVTASELNNDYFLIEKSDNAQLYDYVGLMEGNGTTTEMNEYTFLDSEKQEGVVYYKLTQYDFNGENEIYTTNPVNCQTNIQPDTEEFYIITDKSIGCLNIQANLPKSNSFYQVYIYNAAGTQVYFGEHYTSNGQIDDNIHLSNLNTGVYLVQIVSEHINLSNKVLW